MREIKFRYKIKRVNDEILTKFFTIEMVEDGALKPYLDDGDEIISRDLFTGQKDENGKEMYEKDRVTTNHYSTTWSGRKGVIEWLPNSAKFIITNGKTGYNKQTCGITNAVKVTGTIY